MARRKSLLDLLDELAPDVRDAFVQSISRITTQVQLSALEDAIGRNDAAAVLQMLDLDRSYFSLLERAFTDAYVQTGDDMMAELMRQASAQGVRVAGYFDGRAPMAERYLAEQSSRLITGPDGLMDDIRANARLVMTKGMELGTSPRTAALNLVGRINRKTGFREGGVIGLLTSDADMSIEMERGLIAGDPDQMRRYLRSINNSRNLRDEVGVRRVLRALDSGEALPAKEARVIVQRWRNQKLRLRGETIARTELLGSMHHAQNEGLQQMVDSGKVRADAISREWDSSEDSATRLSHRVMDEQKRKLGEDFVTGLGNRARYPGDELLPAEDRINCRCHLKVRVSFVKGLKDRLTPEQLRRAREMIAEDG